MYMANVYLIYFFFNSLFMKALIFFQSLLLKISEYSAWNFSISFFRGNFFSTTRYFLKYLRTFSFWIVVHRINSRRLITSSELNRHMFLCCNKHFALRYNPWQWEHECQLVTQKIDTLAHPNLSWIFFLDYVKLFLMRKFWLKYIPDD